MTRWRTIAGAVLLGALILPARDHWKAGSFALHTWQRLRAANRNSPAADLDRFYAGQLTPALAGARTAGLIVSPVLPTAVAERLPHLLQYALAPTILVPARDADVVVVAGPVTPGHEPETASYTIIYKHDDPELRVYRRRGR